MCLVLDNPKLNKDFHQFDCDCHHVSLSVTSSQSPMIERMSTQGWTILVDISMTKKEKGVVLKMNDGISVELEMFKKKLTIKDK